MPKFIIQNIKTQEEQVYDLFQDLIVLGRTNTCDIELPQKSVSRRHAEITQENQEYFITDLKSGNGTLLNNQKLSPEEKHLLRSGDVIRIEDYEIRFYLEEEHHYLPIEEDTDTDILEIKLIKKMMRALDREEIPSLEILNGNLAGKRFYLADDKNEFTIGRDDSCEIPLPENVLSRAHAKLEKKWGGIVLTDLKSKNGCFVNNESVKEKILHDGDRILLGTIKILYRNPLEVKAQITHQELARKKKEAAIAEAENLALRRAEEERMAQEAAEAQRLQEEAEAKALEESLQTPESESPPETAPTEHVPAHSNEAPPSTPSAPTEAQPPTTLPLTPEKPQLSTLEKVFIGIGILVGLIALGGIVSILV